MEVIVMKRVLDKDGNPVPWIIEQIPQEEFNMIKKDHTTVTRDKRTKKMSEEFDDDGFNLALMVRAVKFPNLKDKELMESYGVKTGKGLIKKMLSVGELARLSEAVLDHNDFDSEEIIEEVKNS